MKKEMDSHAVDWKGGGIEDVVCVCVCSYGVCMENIA